MWSHGISWPTVIEVGNIWIPISSGKRYEQRYKSNCSITRVSMQISNHICVANKVGQSGNRIVRVRIWELPIKLICYLRFGRTISNVCSCVCVCLLVHCFSSILISRFHGWIRRVQLNDMLGFHIERFVNRDEFVWQ